LQEEKERAKQFVALTDQVVRSVSAGIVATDLTGMVLQINPAGARILGIQEPDNAIDLPLEEVMPLKDGNWGLLRGRVRARAPMRHEGHLLTTGTRLGLTIGHLVDEHGSSVGFIVNFQDLSELELATENQRTQERMAAVGEMAARMAHEIKNPLASISGSAQVLTTAQAMGNTERRLLNIVVDESRRLSTILDGFLNYVRPGGSSHALFDLVSLLRDCSELLRSSDELHSYHDLRVSLPDELPFFGSETLVRQIFWNLSRNALQAMPDGGELRISAEREPDSAILRWTDSGIGMPEEIRTRAMEPFVTARSHGTGLGLAVTYAAVEEHGGTIDINSSPGKGTTVTVALPIAMESR
jgi:two-component system sensor histidine kinase PilS (NtrC family)